MPDSHRRAALAVLAASVLFSTGGAAIKAADFSGWQIASLRSGIAGLTLLLLVPAARRGWGWRPLLVGTAYAALDAPGEIKPDPAQDLPVAALDRLAASITNESGGLIRHLYGANCEVPSRV